MHLRTLAVWLALTAACASGSSDKGMPVVSPTASAPGASATATPTPTPTATPTRARGVSKVLTVVLENHGPGAARARMPYLLSLASAHGSTTNYRAITHPSLPNYITLAAGSTRGVTDDGSPARHRLQGTSVFDAALARGRTAGTYAEGMTGTCDTASHDSYAARHNPWVYFASPASRTACSRYDVPAGTTTHGALHDAIASGTLPNVGLLVPDLCHDGHDCGLRVADDWLRSWLQQVLDGPDYTAGHLAVVVTFDEDEGRGDVTSRVLTVVVAPGVDHLVVATGLDHRSWSRWMTDLVGATPLGDARSSTSLGDAFGL